MADFSLKKTALQLLVTNGILTDDECEKCICAIGYDSTNSTFSPTVIINSNSCIFRDEKALIEYKGISRSGSSYQVHFMVLNKTKSKINVEANDVRINGFPLGSCFQIVYRLSAYDKESCEFYISEESLKPCNISGIDDMYELDLRIKYEDTRSKFAFESDLISLIPYEVEEEVVSLILYEAEEEEEDLLI